MQHKPTPENDGRSDAARAYQWASEIVSVALVMVGPPLLGWYVSRWLGGPRWQVAWISLGGALGLWLGMHQLLLIAKRPPSSREGADRESSSSGDSGVRGDGGGGAGSGSPAEGRRRSDQ